MSLFAPPLRALAQFDDPAFLGVVARSVLGTLAAFVVLAILIARAAAAVLAGHAWLGGVVGGVLGGVGAAVLAFYFFLPVAGAVAMLFVDRIAAAVEWRWYPGTPPPNPAPFAAQAWDGLALGLRAFALQAIALLLTLTPLAPVAVPLGWLVAAWAVGRGLFVAVAMRHMGRPQATALYLRLRPSVLAQGALIALGSWVPLFNLLVPVLGTAAMVHVLHGVLHGGE